MGLLHEPPPSVERTRKTSGVVGFLSTYTMYIHPVRGPELLSTDIDGRVPTLTEFPPLFKKLGRPSTLRILLAVCQEAPPSLDLLKPNLVGVLEEGGQTLLADQAAYTSPFGPTARLTPNPPVVPRMEPPIETGVDEKLAPLSVERENRIAQGVTLRLVKAV